MHLVSIFLIAGATYRLPIRAVSQEQTEMPKKAKALHVEPPDSSNDYRKEAIIQRQLESLSRLIKSKQAGQLGAIQVARERKGADGRRAVVDWTRTRSEGGGVSAYWRGSWC